MKRQASWLALVVVVALVGPGCSASQGRQDEPPGPSSQPSQQLAERPSPIIGAKDGLTVTLALDRDVVIPGGTVGMDVTVGNNRATPAVLAFGTCGGPASVHLEAGVPWEPSGAEWDGIAEEFKRFALAEGMGPGGVPAAQDVRIDVRAKHCPEVFGEYILEPGEARSGQLSWSAEIVAGVPALVGEVAIVVDVAYDRPEPTLAPPCDGPCGSTVLLWKSFSTEGRIQIEGDVPRIVTAGEAVDAMLGDQRFASWLPELPPTTWSGANLFLGSNLAPSGIVPQGPSWQVELFREIGVPRNWAIGFVDPFTAEVRHIEFCNEPCDR